MAYTMARWPKRMGNDQEPYQFILKNHNGQKMSLTNSANRLYYLHQQRRKKMRLISNNGKTAHVYHSGKYYFVSDNGKETLIFPSNSRGDVEWNCLEVGGAIGASLTEVIGDFANFLHTF